MREGSKKTGLLLIFLIVLSALVVRFVSLDKVPASLFYDETDLGYQVRSLLTTGKDYRGVSSPFFFRSMNTDKTPLPIFFSALTSVFFTSAEYQVRAGAALAGVICVTLAMILTFQLTGKRLASVITGLVFAFSPWQIHFSRIAFEAIFMLMVFLASICVFLYWRTSRKSWAFFLSAILLGLNVYTYRIMSLFAPMAALVLIVIFFREFWKEGILRFLIWLFLFGLMVLPFMYATTIASADQSRINQVSIFSSGDIPIMVMRNREVDSGDYTNPQVGKQAVLSSFFFHNKVSSYLIAFGNNYLKSFSTEFLFLSGDPNIRHTANRTGVLLLVDVVGLVAGLVVVWKKIKDKKFQLLAVLLFLSPIPADITMDGGNHASRLMIMSGPLLLIIGLGYTSVFKWLWENRKYRWWFFVLLGPWLLSLILYLHQYFVHFPIESSRQFGYGYKQMVDKIQLIKDQYKSVKITENLDPPMLYYLFWANIPPKTIQEYGTEFGEKTIKNQPLDLIKPYYWDYKVCEVDEINKLNPQVLYVVPFQKLSLDFRGGNKDKVPTGIKLIDLVKRPDNEVAFYFVTRDTVKGVAVQPDEKDICK